VTEKLNTVGAQNWRLNKARYKLEFPQHPNIEAVNKRLKKELVALTLDMYDDQLREGVIGPWKHREAILKLITG
jgi:hypothetical protein